jgi:hypothetical protein
MLERLSYSIEEFSQITGIGRTKLYEAIDAGTLVARKHDKRTLILAEEGEAFLRALPKAGKARAVGSDADR